MKRRRRLGLAGCAAILLLSCPLPRARGQETSPGGKNAPASLIGAARVMKRDAETGSIAPGKAADVILVEGDPTKRIADIRRVVTVILGGSVYDAAALYAALGVRPATRTAAR
jgi:cytosine/adenosine deaminase-related metal-dependent hydrolase